MSLSIRQVNIRKAYILRKECFPSCSYFPCNFELIVRNHQTGKEVIVTPSTRVRCLFFVYSSFNRII